MFFQEKLASLLRAGKPFFNDLEAKFSKSQIFLKMLKEILTLANY